MRLLCCHGYGMSSEIFEQMMQSIMSEVGHHREYVFLDGEVTVNRSAMADFIPGRHLAYWGMLGVQRVLSTATLAYSQGGAFVLGYLLQHLMDHPGKPLPFKFSVFFGTPAALSSDAEYNTDEIMSALSKVSEKEAQELHEGFISRQGHKDPREFDVVKEGRVTGTDKEIFIALLNMVQASLGARKFFGIEESDKTKAIDEDSYSLENFPRFFNAVYTTQRINIPTVRIRGHFDDPAPTKLAEIAQEMCDPAQVQLIKYNGVHEVPYQKEDTTRIRQAIEKAYIVGQMQSFAVPDMQTMPVAKSAVAAA